MLVLMISFVLFLAVIIIMALLKGIIAISPFLLLICLFPMMDYLLIRWLLRKRK